MCADANIPPAAGEDEIDWDEDDNKATTAPAAAAVAAGDQGQVANPQAVPNQKVDTDPAKTTDLKVTGGEGAPTAADGAVAASGAARHLDGSAKPSPYRRPHRTAPRAKSTTRDARCSVIYRPR